MAGRLGEPQAEPPQIVTKAVERDAACAPMRERFAHRSPGEPAHIELFVLVRYLLRSFTPAAALGFAGNPGCVA